MNARVGRIFEFGDYRLDAGRRLLFRRGDVVSIAPKAFDTLAVLVERHGETLTKDELQRLVWPDTFVEEGNLTQNVSLARKALAESPDEHRYIITVPRLGYRFAAPVREVTPTALERARQSPNPKAYEAYVKGRYFLDKRLTETLTKAIVCFREATDEDPLYGLAYVGLADAWALLSLYGASKPRDAFPQSRAAALTALQLDDTLAEAHNSLGVVELFYGWNWEAAEGAFRRALALKPEYADAHQRFGIYLTAMGRFDEAAAELERACELNPLSLISATIAGYPAYYSRDYDRAAERFRSVIQIDPNFSMAHYRLALAYMHQGRLDEALEELNVSKQLSNDRDVIAAIGRAHALRGDIAGAEAAIAEILERSRQTFVSPYMLGVIHGALGDTDRAFALLEKAVEMRSYWVIYLNVDPALDALRGDPRFDALRARVGLQPAPPRT